MPASRPVVRLLLGPLLGPLVGIVLLLVVFLAVVLLGVVSPLAAEEQDTAFAGFARAPDPATTPGPDADLFARAVALQAERRFRSARTLFFRLVEEFPDSPYAAEADDRSSPNAFLGVARMSPPRPSERRVDVALMGDGYRLDDQDRFLKDAAGHLQVLLAEPVFAAYEPYFVFWRFDLASRDAGVDEVAPLPPDEEEEAHAKRRRRPRPVRTYETALDCKAAGPQGQVMADPACVHHYLGYLPENDGLAACFAKKGVLGMGGGGIATTAPKGVVVHEFGHAFVDLLDEYVNQPGPPAGATESANTTTYRERPPWQHFLDAKVPGVGIYEGGATYATGVWRPAASCAMNSGGSRFCPVCREAAVLAIYGYVSPIDGSSPEEDEVTPGPEGPPAFRVVPMAPATHDLEVAWYLGPAPEPGPGAAVAEPERTAEDDFADDFLSEEQRRAFERRRRERAAAGTPDPGASPESASEAPPGTGSPPKAPARGGARRSLGTGHEARPSGTPLRARRVTLPDGRKASEAVLPPLAALAPGRHLLTAVVRDPTRIRGERFPWVLKDDRGLLEDRRAWVLVVPAPSPR